MASPNNLTASTVANLSNPEPGAGLRAFVTGANGFLGAHLVEGLLRHGYHVTAMVRRSSKLAALEGLPVALVHGDVTALEQTHPDEDLPKVRTALARADFILHVAGATKVANPDDFFRINGDGARRFAELCLSANAKPTRYVLVSSLAAIGPAEEGHLVSDSDPPHPISNYGRSKLAGEQATLAFAHEMPITIIRPPAIYGPRDTNMLPIFRLAHKGYRLSLGGGKTRAALVHVEDVVAAILTAMTHPDAVGQAMLVGDMENVSQAEIMQRISAAVGKSTWPIYVPAAVMRSLAGVADALPAAMKFKYLNSDRINDFLAPSWMVNDAPLRKLGFSNRYDLSSGLAHTARWYAQHGLLD